MRIDVFQIEARQAAAVLHQFALALHDVDQHVALAVDRGGELSRWRWPEWSSCDGSASTPRRPWSRCRATAASRRAAAVSSTSPERMPACTAAPSATTSSGFSSVCGLARNSVSTALRTSGMRVEPPTSTTSSICSTRDAGVRDALAARRRACGRRSAVISCSNSSRVDLALVAACRGIRARIAVAGTKDSCFLGLDHRAPQQLHGFAVVRKILAPFGCDIFERDAAAADCRCRRRPGACRRWWPALRRCRRAAAGSKCRTCRRRDRRPRRCLLCACRARRRAPPRSARSPAAAPRVPRCGRRPWWPAAARR